MTLYTAGIPALIIDLLELDGGWVTGQGIVSLVQTVRPDAQPETIRRALARMVKNHGDLLEHRDGSPRMKHGIAYEYRAA